MVSVIKVDVISNELKELFNITNEELYEIYFDNTLIGYVLVRNNLNDRLLLVIMNEYQNNGYGSKAFKIMIDKLNKPIICKVEKNNSRMIRIINNNNGIEIGRNKDNILFKIE